MNYFTSYYKELCHNILDQKTLIKREEKLNVSGKKFDRTLFVH